MYPLSRDKCCFLIGTWHKNRGKTLFIRVLSKFLKWFNLLTLQGFLE